MKRAIERIRTFNQEREWEQFHTPENLAKSIMIEAGELLECFQWSNEFDRQAVKEELADVMTYCIDMADALKVDLEEIILEKMDQNEAKYPVEKARGNSKKYNEF
ncbi:MAG: nucleotide pyrophosphohydrolase [Erysipelotrichaceae bacterium]|nr:nucleotide pyrophosphohydrolase [Erysipelotrichaceae bacterium]